MRCADCVAGTHNHRGECQGPVYERRGDLGGNSWITNEVIGLCQCIDDSQMIIEQRALQVAALRASINEALVECLFFTMKDDDGCVICVDGDVDTQDIAETVFEYLKREGWTMLNGGVPSAS